jgi:hypothetical protein
MAVVVSEIPPTVIPIATEYVPLFPIGATVRYDATRIVAGRRPFVHGTIWSRAAVPLRIDSVALALSHSEIFEVGADIRLDANGAHRFKVARTLPPAISEESIDAVIFRIGNAKIRIDKIYCDPLHISPDASACAVEWTLPKRCVIHTEFPLVVRLRAADQRLKKVEIWFGSGLPVTISGRFGGVQIGKSRAHLPDIEPNGVVELPLTITASQEVHESIDMVLSFGTALAGVGEFVNPIPLAIESPFAVRLKYFDTNWQELEVRGLAFETGSYIVVEGYLTNILGCPVTICAVRGTLVSVEAGALPAVVRPREAFTFIGRAVKPGQAEISIAYEAETVGAWTLPLKTAAIEHVPRSVTFTLDAPPTGVRFQRVDARIVIEKSDSPTRSEADVSVISIEVQQVNSFYVEGPTKKAIVVFAGQKREISIGFFPLEAGPMTLPPMTVTETTLTGHKAKKFVAPIVITFQ